MDTMVSDERKIVVAVKRHTSPEYVLKIGETQGSVIRPLIFSLFINDLPMDVNPATVKIYCKLIYVC